MAMPKEYFFRAGVYGMMFAALMLTSQAHSQAAKNANELKFNSIEQYDNRSTVLLIKEKLDNEKKAKELREKNFQSIEAGYINAMRTKKDDEQIVEFINLRKRLVEAEQELKLAIEHQVELAGLIEKSMAGGGLLPQVQTYITDARAQLQSMGVAQEMMKKKLATSIRQIDTAIKNVPPPASYKTADGTEFRLVSAGRNSFYISSEPLGENITLEEAYKASVAMTQAESGTYRLPGITELKILSQLNMTPEKAVWSSHIWSYDAPEESRMSERFGVRLYMIWDPRNTLGRGVTFGELPFARHPKVAYYLVTSSRTGVQGRWNRIVNSLK